MSQRFDGRVAFITGAARGQGREHAVRFAEEGADIIAVDICGQIPTVAYPMSGPEDLDETVKLVEKTGRRIIAEQADVRDFGRLREIAEHGATELGRIDFVLANAGIGNMFGEQSFRIEAYLDSIDVLLNGVYYTVEAALPALLQNDDGGAIVITSSAAGFKSVSGSFSTRSHGGAGYTAAKHGVVGLMRYFATSLAEKRIRVNTVHPTGVATPMILNEYAQQYAVDHPDFAELQANLLPVPLVESSDITEAIMYLCGESGRYVTGVTLPVDAGLNLK